MQDISDSQGQVDIRYVGALGLVPRGIRVFIDRECAGELNATEQRVQPFLVTPDFHTVSLKCVVWRSETLDVNLSPGEKTTLQFDFGRPKMLASHLSIAASLAMAPLCLVGLYLTGIAAGGLALVGFGFAISREWLTPGAYPSLRPQAEFQLPEAPPPRMTIRRWMILVAVIAFLLAVGVEERLMQRRSEIEIRRNTYRSLAKIDADIERHWRKREAELARLEALSLKRIETLSKLIRLERERDSSNAQLQKVKRDLDALRAQLATNSQDAASAAQSKEKDLEAATRIRLERERNSWNTQLQEVKRDLDAVRAQRATNAQYAASAAQSKEKHLDAATRPWEPVEGDPRRP